MLPSPSRKKTCGLNKNPSLNNVLLTADLKLQLKQRHLWVKVFVFKKRFSELQQLKNEQKSVKDSFKNTVLRNMYL